MNMIVLPGSRNELPDSGEDDDGRRFFIKEIQKLHKRASMKIPRVPDCRNRIYMCKRVGLISHLVLLLTEEKISKKEYFLLSQEKNIDIIEWLYSKGLSPRSNW